MITTIVTAILLLTAAVMINGTGKTGKIIAIHATGLTPAQLRRNKAVEVEGTEGKFEPVELIRLGLH